MIIRLIVKSKYTQVAWPLLQQIGCGRFSTQTEQISPISPYSTEFMLNTLGSTETSAGKKEAKPVGKKRQPPSNHNKEWQMRERRKLYSPYRII